MCGNHHDVKECLEIFEVNTKISMVDIQCSVPVGGFSFFPYMASTVFGHAILT